MIKILLTFPGQALLDIMMRKFAREVKGRFVYWWGDDARETDRQVLHHNEAIRGLLSRNITTAQLDSTAYSLQVREEI